MRRRIDAVVITGAAVLALEFASQDFLTGS
jgi:hypothetical protein